MPVSATMTNPFVEIGSELPKSPPIDATPKKATTIATTVTGCGFCL